MRVLLSTIGSRGDVQPLVALALRLRALGQEVRLCVPPDFQDWISNLGIPVNHYYHTDDICNVVAITAPLSSTATDVGLSIPVAVT